MSSIKLKELFASIQGEGPLVGYKQIFIRLCGCNLKCKYCDTDFDEKNAKEYTISELLEYVKKNSECHSVSLTGGEPLLHTDFIKEFVQFSPIPIYLETNATLYEQLNSVIDYIEYISADIKLPSATGMPAQWDIHDKFFEITSKKNLYAKVVFDSKITDDEIENVCNLAKKHNIELVLQPMMIGKTPSIKSEFMQQILDRCLQKHKRTRLIPQVHKFIDVE